MVWTNVATTALFFTGLVMVLSRAIDGINNLSAPLTLAAIAAIAQAGADPIWPFFCWFVLTTLFSPLSPSSSSQRDTTLEAATAPLLAIAGVVFYPLVLFVKLTTFTSPAKSSKDG